MNLIELNQTVIQVKQTVLQAIHAAGSGHPGGSLSAADIVTALYFDAMNINPEDPKMPGRDRFVLSKGHAAPILYSALAHRGYFPVEDVLSLRKLGSKFQGHPDMHKVKGVEMSTGSLGQGLSVCVGMALAAKLDNDPGRIYTLMGDGELQEGMVWEAAMAANHYKLNNITAFVDWNGLQIDGKNEDVMTVAPLKEKFAAFGWNVLSIDGHNLEEILAAVEAAKAYADGPTMIIAKTHKGHGVSFMEDQAGWHGKAPNDQQLEQALAELRGAL
ncbi:MAG: transketolase [Anaerovoracaceae bacterium]